MRKSPPAPGPVRNIAYPEVHSDELANELTVLTVTDDFLPRTAVLLALPTGRSRDPEDAHGLLRLATEMLKEGTEQQEARQIAETFDRFAINFDTDVYLEYSLLSLTLLDIHLEQAVSLLSDLVFRSTFPEEQFRKLLIRSQSQLLARRADPGYLGNERFFQALFGDHPYSRITTRPEHLDSIDRDRVASFWRQICSPRGALLLFAGPVSASNSKHLGEKYFGDWKARGEPAEIPEPTMRPPTISIVDRPNSVQSNILVGGRALARRHPDFVALRVLNQILGGSGSARLFLNLREKHGYTYGAYSSLRGYQKGGVQLAASSVRAENTADALREIAAEMRGMETHPPGESELKRARAELIGSFLRRMETPSSVGTLEVTRRLLGLSDRYFQEYIPQIDSIREDDVVRQARAFLQPEDCTTVIVGDRKIVEPQIEDDAVALFDASGNLIG